MTPETIPAIKIFTGGDLHFDDSLFVPMKTKTEIDVILSKDGGFMKATNMMVTGGPGGGKSTLVLDWLGHLVMAGYKCLFISGEMDEIAYYKYCKRLPIIKKVPVMFLRQYGTGMKAAVEEVLKQGWDIVGVDSMAEVLATYKEFAKVTEGAAEKWFLDLQEEHKKGNNDLKIYTSFVNIQQVGKNGVFVGSNRLKHMVDAMAHIEVKENKRTIYFSKNRDNDINFKIFFTISKDGVYYAFEKEEGQNDNENGEPE